jgi:hypothetical protein
MSKSGNVVNLVPVLELRKAMSEAADDMLYRVMRIREAAVEAKRCMENGDEETAKDILSWVVANIGTMEAVFARGMTRLSILSNPPDGGVRINVIRASDIKPKPKEKKSYLQQLKEELGSGDS